MTRNLGKTSLRRRRRANDPMREFDHLPPALRAWVADASLPWRAGSVKAAFEKALERTGDADMALQELDRIQSNLIAKDARKVWGHNHPHATH